MSENPLGEAMRLARHNWEAKEAVVDEEQRGEGLVVRILEILASEPTRSRRSLPAYRLAARLAFETAAASAEQPVGRP